jgi:hypothetical protein
MVAIEGPHYFDWFPLDFRLGLENSSELYGTTRGVALKLRLRPDGNLDVLRWWVDRPADWYTGVLVRVP